MNRSKNRIGMIIVALLAAALAPIDQAEGQTKTFIGASGSYFHVSTSWSPSGAPGPSNSVLFSNPSIYTIGWNPITSTITEIDIAHTTGTGAATVTTGGLLEAVELYVALYGDGSLTVSTGGQVQTSATMIGMGSAGLATITGVGSKLHADSQLVVGVYENGTMDVTGGAKVTSQSGIIGFSASAIGQVNVSGYGALGESWTKSDWTVSQELKVDNGSSLNIENLGRVQAASTRIGIGSGMSNVSIFSGGGLTVTNNIVIGENVGGTLNIGGGGYLLLTRALYI